MVVCAWKTCKHTCICAPITVCWHTDIATGYLNRGGVSKAHVCICVSGDFKGSLESNYSYKEMTLNLKTGDSEHIKQIFSVHLQNTEVSKQVKGIVIIKT